MVEEKYQRVANYADGMNHEIDMIAHSCGVRARARAAKREHVRIVQANGQIVALNMLYPYPKPKVAPERAGAGLKPATTGGTRENKSRHEENRNLMAFVHASEARTASILLSRACLCFPAPSVLPTESPPSGNPRTVFTACTSPLILKGLVT